jgi:uncharacterized RDD family membrane protein YckC
MTNYDSTRSSTGPVDARFDPELNPDLYDGILAKRVVAFFIDVLIVALLMVPAFLLVFIIGVVTLGLGFLLLPPVFAIVALGYVALTLGGPNSATIGMRATNIEMRTGTGGRMFPLLAAMHALIFWFSVSILTPLVLVVGLLSNRSRLLHDILLNTVMVNSAAIDRVERGLGRP